ncbi:MAG: phage holin family protein [Candidimonas sp.]|nr:MAG: phage holin family protein [Candidimonas sp.]TAM22793.1 MAG: phage holin family protein [Candidimonas sp.]TAM73687.1 MAG: phage holin family protein [Candidimonas sp.]
MAIRQSVGELTSTLLSIVSTRVELFAFEAAGQKTRLFKLLGLAFAALLFSTLALLVFSLTLALYFWPTDYRYWALGVLVVVYGALGFGFFWAVRRALLGDPTPFNATLDELRRDFVAVQRLCEPSGSEHSDAKDTS